MNLPWGRTHSFSARFSAAALSFIEAMIAKWYKRAFSCFFIDPLHRKPWLVSVMPHYMTVGAKVALSYIRAHRSEVRGQGHSSWVESSCSWVAESDNNHGFHCNSKALSCLCHFTIPPLDGANGQVTVGSRFYTAVTEHTFTFIHLILGDWTLGGGSSPLQSRMFVPLCAFDYLINFQCLVCFSLRWGESAVGALVLLELRPLTGLVTSGTQCISFSLKLTRIIPD